MTKIHTIHYPLWVPLVRRLTSIPHKVEPQLLRSSRDDFTPCFIGSFLTTALIFQPSGTSALKNGHFLLFWADFLLQVCWKLLCRSSYHNFGQRAWVQRFNHLLRRLTPSQGTKMRPSLELSWCAYDQDIKIHMEESFQTCKTAQNCIYVLSIHWLHLLNERFRKQRCEKVHIVSW